MAEIAEQLSQLKRPFALGTNNLGWTSTGSKAFELLDVFFEAGPALIDTADVYKAPVWKGPQDDHLRAEVVLGEWIASRKMPAGQVVIATKVGADPVAAGLRASSIKKAVDASLTRLNVERLDICYAHKDDPEGSLEESIRAFDQLIDAGKIGGVGLSTFSPERIVEWVETADRIGARRPVSLMARYNLLARRSFEQDFLPLIRRFDLAGFAYFALASGILTGKFESKEQVAGTARARMTSLFTSDQVFNFLPVLREVAVELGCSPSAVATAWLMGRDGVQAPVLGARNADQLRDTLSGLRKLPEDVITHLNVASEPFA